MKFYLTSAVLLTFSCQLVVAQGDSVKVKTNQEEPIKLSKSFMKALDAAFSFGPIEAPLPKQTELTIEQLHEWVGEPTEHTQPIKKDKFDLEYKAAKMWVREFYVPDPTLPLAIDLGIRIGKGEARKYNPQPSVGFGFDSQKIAKYIRPSEIKLRKARSSADKIRAQMDILYPIEP